MNRAEAGNHEDLQIAKDKTPENGRVNVKHNSEYLRDETLEERQKLPPQKKSQNTEEKITQKEVAYKLYKSDYTKSRRK